MFKNILICFAVFVIVVAVGYLSVGIPMMCNNCSLSDMSSAGNAINGFSSIVIGAAGVAASFMAFFIQYKANIQLKKENQKIVFRQNFSEIFHRHQQLLDSMQLKYKKKVKDGYEFNNYVGHEVFSKILSNLNGLYGWFKCVYGEYGDYGNSGNPRLDAKQVFRKAFQFVWNSSRYESTDIFRILWHLVWNESWDESIIKYPKNEDYCFEMKVRCLLKDCDRNLAGFRTGFENILLPYYKRLFNILDFVQRSEILDDKEKQDYFNLVRSEMVNDEQTLLYYYWLSGKGNEFENETNHFFVLWHLVDDVYPRQIPEELRFN